MDRIQSNSEDVPILLRACAERDIDPSGMELIHHSSNAVYLLPKADAIARVGRSPSQVANLSHIYDITRWLSSETDVGATSPLAGTPPVLIGNTAISFWKYYPQSVDRVSLDSVHLAGLLRRLHEVVLPGYIDLPRWQPLESLHSALNDDELRTNVTGDDRDWLLRRIVEIREQFGEFDWPLGIGLIHGDAWSGNLLWDTSGDPMRPILGDWDWVSVGPREVDLVPTWHAAIRYGRSRKWVRDFIGEYGYDLANWSGYSALLDMRDLVQITGPLRRAADSADYAMRLRQRLTDLRAGRKTTPWSQYR